MHGPGTPTRRKCRLVAAVAAAAAAIMVAVVAVAVAREGEMRKG